MWLVFLTGPLISKSNLPLKQKHYASLKMHRSHKGWVNLLIMICTTAGQQSLLAKVKSDWLSSLTVPSITSLIMWHSLETPLPHILTPSHQHLLDHWEYFKWKAGFFRFFQCSKKKIKRIKHRVGTTLTQTTTIFPVAKSQILYCRI